MDTHGKFSAISQKAHNFCDFWAQLFKANDVVS